MINRKDLRRSEMFTIILSIVVAVVKALGFTFIILPFVILVAMVRRLQEGLYELGCAFFWVTEWCVS